jgi:hypothetical protein
LTPSVPIGVVEPALVGSPVPPSAIAARRVKPVRADQAGCDDQLKHA